MEQETLFKKELHVFYKGGWVWVSWHQIIYNGAYGTEYTRLQLCSPCCKQIGQMIYHHTHYNDFRPDCFVSLKGQGPQGIFSFVTQWGNCKFLLEHFKDTNYGTVWGHKTQSPSRLVLSTNYSGMVPTNFIDYHTYQIMTQINWWKICQISVENHYNNEFETSLTLMSGL